MSRSRSWAIVNKAYAGTTTISYSPDPLTDECWYQWFGPIYRRLRS